MRIGREYKPCEVEFGNGLNIGEVFYYRGEYDSKEELYMKIRYIEYDECPCDMVRYNAVNLEDGSLTFVDDDDTVTIANVHIEKD
jgi:hypothetical protein